MDPDDLAAVAAIARLGSVTAAADALHVAQPALSRRLASLERELGGPLFVRGRHGASPTPAGRLLADRAPAVLQSLARARDEVTDVLAGRAGRLRLGTTPTLGTDLLPDVLAALRAGAPELALELVARGDSRWLTDEVAAGRLDVAAAALEAPVPSGTRVALAARQDFVLALPADHPLAARSHVGVRALGELGFVTLGTGQGLRGVLDATLATLGLEPDIAIEAGEREMLLPFVAAGLGVALLPAHFAAARAGGGVVLRPLRPAVTRPVGIVVRDDHGELVARFLAVASGSPLLSSVGP